MKLRNKKTGEIKEIPDGFFCGDNLKKICEEWEDYEESKESEYYWYIGYKNDIRRTKYHHISDFADNQVTVTRKEIGNCFESLEEAEKAVEKLKAWKRLKDKGFRFSGYELVDGTIRFMIDLRPLAPDDLYPDLDLLFGGEE